MANGTPVVTKEVEFGNMKLVLSRNVMAEIQKQVNSLTSSPKYYQMKVDRMLLYFPVIERVFKEEGVPEDFKYLAIQESGLSPMRYLLLMPLVFGNSKISQRVK